MWFFSGNEGQAEAQAEEPQSEQGPVQPEDSQQHPAEKGSETTSQETEGSSTDSPWSFWGQLAAVAQNPGEVEEDESLSSATSSDEDSGTNPVHLSSIDSATSTEQQTRVEGPTEHEQPAEQAPGWSLWGQLVGSPNTEGAAPAAAADADVESSAVHPDTLANEESSREAAQTEESGASAEQPAAAAAAAAGPGVFNWNLIGGAASWIQPQSTTEAPKEPVAEEAHQGDIDETDRAASSEPAASTEAPPPDMPQRHAEEKESQREDDSHSSPLNSPSSSSSAEDSSGSEAEAESSVPGTSQQAASGSEDRPESGLKDSHFPDDAAKQQKEIEKDTETSKSIEQAQSKGARFTKAKPKPPASLKLGKAPQELSSSIGAAAAPEQQQSTVPHLQQAATTDSQPGTTGEQQPADAPTQQQQTATTEEKRGAAAQNEVATGEQMQPADTSDSKDSLDKTTEKSDVVLPQPDAAAAAASAASSPLAKLLARRLPKHSGSFVERSLPDGTTIIITTEEGGASKPKPKPPGESGLLLPPPSKGEIPKTESYPRSNKHEELSMQKPKAITPQPQDTAQHARPPKPKPPRTASSKPLQASPTIAPTPAQMTEAASINDDTSTELAEKTPSDTEQRQDTPASKQGNQDAQTTDAVPIAHVEADTVPSMAATGSADEAQPRLSDAKEAEGSAEKPSEDESKAKAVVKLPLPSKALGAKGPPPLPKSLGAKAVPSVEGKGPGDAEDPGVSESKKEEGSAEKPSEDESKAKAVGKLPLPSKALGAKGPPPLPKSLG
ncbi:hypothetical protein, conserved, partial [Eimeria acervulina]